MNSKEKAASAKRLGADEGFQLLIFEIREDALGAFENSDPSDAGVHSRANATLHALKTITGKLDSWIEEQAFIEQKGHDRGNE